MSWRDTGAGEIRIEQVGKTVTLAGWVARRRDHGGLVFVDLRDESGVCQLVINPERSPEAASVAHDIRNEFVLRAEGELVARSPDTVNPRMETGEVELQLDRLQNQSGLAIEAMAELSRAPPGPRRRHPAPEGMGRQMRRVRLDRQRKDQSDAFAWAQSGVAQRGGQPAHHREQVATRDRTRSDLEGRAVRIGPQRREHRSGEQVGHTCSTPNGVLRDSFRGDSRVPSPAVE